MTNADAGACVACRKTNVGSVWEEPRYPLHPGGNFEFGERVSRGVTLLPGGVCDVNARWYYGATEMF